MTAAIIDRLRLPVRLSRDSLTFYVPDGSPEPVARLLAAELDRLVGEQCDVLLDENARLRQENARLRVLLSRARAAAVAEPDAPAACRKVALLLSEEGRE